MSKQKVLIIICVSTMVSSIALGQLPDEFDWRNVNGENWMTSVKNQGLCCSCWAFTAVGTVEAQYNIFFGWPSYDIDLSEEYLVSDCFNPWNCAGGWHHDALGFIRDTGISDEACFPYVDSGCSCWCGCTHGCSDAECNDRCAEWSIKLQTIDGTEHVLNTVEAIKNYLYNVGALAVAMDWERGFWDGDIWRCNNPDSYDHCVVVTGYNDIGGYWIAKNSWGAEWNGDGYFKIGYGECWVQNLAYGATLINPRLPMCHQDYDEWVLMGRPGCWAWPYQCDGDADGKTETIFKYRIYGGDLNLIVQNWKKTIEDPNLNPCADVGHDAETVFKYRVYGNDLNIVVANWKKKDADLPGNCASCERGQQAKAGELTFKELVKWLEDVWLDPAVRQVINEDAWLKFVESLMEEIQNWPTKPN